MDSLIKGVVFFSLLAIKFAVFVASTDAICLF